MKQNIFKLFLDKILDFPLTIKQMLYLKLAKEMRDNYCFDFLNRYSDELYSVYIPTITFKGKNELKDKNCGLDNNIYNFLQCCLEGYSIIEITINNFYSLEETSKIFELCIEQGFIKRPESIEVRAMSGYISGKYRLGEYFKQGGMLSADQLQQALINKRINPNKKFGEILFDLGYITQESLQPILIIKKEAQKRFILDYNIVPKVQTQYENTDKANLAEIEKLQQENTKLKNKLVQLLELVKNNAK